jgi:hypothetical protein
MFDTAAKSGKKKERAAACARQSVAAARGAVRSALRGAAAG